MLNGYSTLLNIDGFKNLWGLCRDQMLLDKIPAAVSNVLKKMNFSASKVYVSENLGFNAGATPDGVITIGKDLLDSCSPQEIEFVVGHEIAHVQQRHIAKIFMGLSATLLALFSVDRTTQWLGKKYSVQQHPILHKMLNGYGKIKYFFMNNPLVAFAMFRVWQSAIQRFHEKEADLVSAYATGQAAGGAAFFKRFIQDCAPKETNWLKYLNPLDWARDLDHYLFPSHPSVRERYQYLQEIAQAQKQK